MTQENPNYFKDHLQNLKNLFVETYEYLDPDSYITREPTETFSRTTFLYLWSFFNSLYNIDWKAAGTPEFLQYLKEDEYGRMLGFYSEEQKIDLFAEYLFDRHFDTALRRELIAKVLEPRKNFVVEEVLDDLKPGPNPLGEFYGAKGPIAIARFTDAVRQARETGDLTVDQFKTVLQFVYKTRCNLFHGVPSLRSMDNTGQLKRLRLCNLIMIAVCHYTLAKAIADFR